MTFLPQKKDALYVRGVVIACGMQDDQGDIAPDKEGIKKIFTNYLKQESDVQHSYISNFNVHQLENTITTAPMQINGQEVPVGSWIASHMVLNPSIIAMIRNNNLTGYSLGAVGDKGLNENITFENGFLNKSLLYKDLRDYEELNPFFISFVDKASNGYTWEVMDYQQFLSKSSIDDKDFDGDIMTNSTQQEVKDEMVSVGVVERLLQPFLNKSSEASDDEAQEEDVEMEKEAEEPVITNEEIMAKLEALPQLVAEGVVEAMKELANKEQSEAPAEEEQELEKESNDEGELEKESEKEEQEEEQSEASAEDEEDDKVEKNSKLNKSSSKLDEMTPPNKKVEPEHKFLGGEKRDELGRVRKYL